MKRSPHRWQRAHGDSKRLKACGKQSAHRWLCGRHAVEEALSGRSRRILDLWILHEIHEPGVSDLVRSARGCGAQVHWVGRKELDRVSAGANHQGLALQVEERPCTELPEFLSALTDADQKSLLLVALDQIQDPHNLGAIARCGVCLGAKALLVPERRSSPVTQAAVQSSAGAIEKIPVLNAGNLSQTLLNLKEKGFWIYGAQREGKPLWDVKFNLPMVLVIGSEGHGMRRLVADRCDELVSIPQSAQGVDSLNASCAAGVILYEISRQLNRSV